MAVCLLVGLLCWGLVRHLPYDEGPDDTLWRAWIGRRNAHLTAREMGPASSRVLLVAVDDAARRRYGYPLPRELYGEVVRRLVEAGCETVAISISFENKSPDEVGDLSLKVTLRHPSVVLPYRFDAQNGQLGRVLPHARLIEGIELEDRLGFSAVPGEGNEVRAVWLKVTQPGHPPHYAFPLVALAKNLNSTPEELLSRVRTRIRRCAVDMVTVEAVEAWLNIPGDWAGIQGSFLPAITVSELLDSNHDHLKRSLSPKSIAVIGETDPQPGVRGFASGAGDGRKGTLAGRFFGPELQAATILNLMLDNFLVATSPHEEMAYIVGICLVVGVLGSLLKLRWFVAGSLTLGAGLVLASHQALADHARLLPVVNPLLSLTLATVATSLLKLHFARVRRRERILDLVREVCPPIELEGPESRTVTVLVASLRDYKYLLERDDSVTGLSALHVYFEAVRTVLAYFGGVVFDYVDNRQVVIFGMVAKSRDNHALMACQAAAGLVSEAERLNQRDLGLPLTRLGISTGECRIVRVLGRPLLQGEALTRASSLPHLARQHNCPVLLTEPTWRAASDSIPAVPIRGEIRKLNVEKLLLELESDDGRMPWVPLEAASDPAQLKEGQTHNHYLLEKLLGQGGMGRVFLARDTRLLRLVAIKVVLGYMDEVHCQRFLTEAQTIARVQHRGIVAIHEAGVKPFPYLVMEFASGVPLDQVLHEKLPPAQAVSLIVQILEALSAVHDSGIVHRDLKPANIMLGPDGQPKLMDFGLARFTEKKTRVTRPGEIWGTPEYMAPEQLEPEFGDVDAVSDLFSVGAILYEALTATRPIKKGPVSMVLYDLIYREPEPPCQVDPEVPEALSRICLKALTKEKAGRYQTAREFARALQAADLTPANQAAV